MVHCCVSSRNLVNEEAMTHWGMLRQKKKTHTHTQMETLGIHDTEYAT